jgi:hypothetical protein
MAKDKTREEVATIYSKVSDAYIEAAEALKISKDLDNSTYLQVVLSDSKRALDSALCELQKLWKANNNNGI